MRTRKAGRTLPLFIKFEAFRIGKPILKLILVFLFAHVHAFADRGRPHINNDLGFKRLLTDKNTLLRGVGLAWDNGSNGDDPANLPTQEQLYALSTSYGLNCIHVYLRQDGQRVDEPTIVSKCDQLVNMASKANLYVIITIGCGAHNGSIPDINWAIQFWNFWAPRYADRTHVIYESHNEPAPYNPAAWVTTDWDNQVVLFNTIRSKAPLTHILTCSFMSFNSPREALDGIGYMRWRGIDFSNASVAFHGYETMSSVEACITQFKYDTGGGMTPALLCTEFDPATSYSGFNNMLESQQIGWVEFTFLRASDQDLVWFKGAMQENNVVWTPDYGKWPQPSVTNVYIDNDISSFQFYPNPVKNLLTYTLPSGMFNHTLTVRDPLGKQVFERLYSSVEYQYIIDIQHWKSGVYMFEISNSQVRKTFIIHKE